MVISTPPGVKLKDADITIISYVCGAIGVIIILAITFCLLRRLRTKRARKYIKQQAKLSIPMGPVLTSQPISRPWKWKEVKANIKARHRGEERPYPKVAVISNGTNGVTRPQSASNGVTRPHSASVNRPQTASINRPQSANVNRPQSANGTTSLGPAQKQMHGENPSQVARHVKHERLQKRIRAKKERKIMKERQKEIKRDLTLLLEGQRLPGDEFPEDRRIGGAANSPITHVGPLRRESLLAIPNLTYVIEQSPRDKKAVHRSTGLKQLDIPQNLCTWEEEGRERGGGNLSSRGSGASARHMLGEVTVHHVTDSREQDSDVESVDNNTTEL